MTVYFKINVKRLSVTLVKLFVNGVKCDSDYDAIMEAIEILCDMWLVNVFMWYEYSLKLVIVWRMWFCSEICLQFIVV